MNQIQVYDRVRLRSGGPLMTVTDIMKPKAKCVWFDNRDAEHSDWFDLNTLILVEGAATK